VIKLRVDLDDDSLEDLKTEVIEAKQLAADANGRMIGWVGDAASTQEQSLSLPMPTQQPAIKMTGSPD
jgi:hypothetical protein